MKAKTILTTILLTIIITMTCACTSYAEVIPTDTADNIELSSEQTTIEQKTSSEDKIIEMTIERRDNSRDESTEKAAEKSTEDTLMADSPIIKLNWEEYTKLIETERVKGSVLVFDTYRFVIYLPEQFQVQPIEKTSINPLTIHKSIAEGTNYSLEIKIGDFPYDVESRKDLIDYFKGNSLITVYNAEINDVSYTDVEDYGTNTIMLVTELRNYTHQEADTRYLMFFFQPMSTEYDIITMTTLASIQSMDDMLQVDEPEPTENTTE